MKTTIDGSLKNLSSGLVLAILGFSGFLFILPLAPSATASNSSPPTVTVTPNPVTAFTSGSQTFSLVVSNPSTNNYPITTFIVFIPSGWTISTCTVGTFLNDNCHVYSGYIQWTKSTTSGIIPGSSDTLQFTATSTPQGPPYPFNSVFNTEIQDASSSAFYPGPSFTIQVIAPGTGVSIITPPSSTTYVAGTAPLTLTAEVTPHQQGVPISFSVSYNNPTATYSLTPQSGVTNSSGMFTSTFQPSNHANDIATITATIGTSGLSSSSITITTVAGSPSTITFTFTSLASNGNYYVTTSGTTTNTGPSGAFTGAKVSKTDITFAITDAFGNPVDFSNSLLTDYTITLTAASSAGGLFDTSGLPSTISCSKGSSWCPSSGTSSTIPYDYFQSPVWGTVGGIRGSVVGTFNGNPFGGSSQTNPIVTSTFASSSPAPTVSPTNPAAGTKVTVSATLNPAQQGVPITLLLDTSASHEPSNVPYGANSVLPVGFPNNALSITLTSDSTGKVSALFTVDTVAGSVAKFQSKVAAPTNTNPTNTLTSGDSNPVTTDPGSPTSFKILTTFDSNLHFSTKTAAATTSSYQNKLYVDVILSDSYGNDILASSAPSSNIQVTLSLSPASPAGGVLSATTLYIYAGCIDTANTKPSSCAATPSPNPVVWTMPSTYPATLTLTASGVISGKLVSNSTAISVVSPLPTFTLKQPKPGQFGVIYTSTNNVLFNGQANVSVGYNNVFVSSVTYSVDKGPAQSISVPSGQSTFSFPALLTFSPGLHSVQFNVTDTVGNKLVGPTYQVLYDPSAPTITFTPASGSSLNASQPLTIVVNDPFGDLNTTTGANGIMIKVNGTALTSGITVTPLASKQLLGMNTTYTVTISNLPTGTDNIQVTVKDYAGNSATASATIHVIVPFAVSALVNSATYTTIGGFNGILVSVTNRWSSTQNYVVFAVWKNSAGQTVAVTTGGLTLAPGQTGNAFAALSGALPSGTYTVNIFVVTVNNQPVSTTTTITVTI